MRGANWRQGFGFGVGLGWIVGFWVWVWVVGVGVGVSVVRICTPFDQSFNGEVQVEAENDKDRLVGVAQHPLLVANPLGKFELVNIKIFDL